MKTYDQFNYSELHKISSIYWCVNVKELEHCFKKIEDEIGLPIITIFNRYNLYFNKNSNKYESYIIYKDKLKKEISKFKENINELYCYIGVDISYRKMNSIDHNIKSEINDLIDLSINSINSINLYWNWNLLLTFFKDEIIYGNTLFDIDHKFGGYVNCNKEEVDLYISTIENIKKYNL